MMTLQNFQQLASTPGQEIDSPVVLWYQGREFEFYVHPTSDGSKVRLALVATQHLENRSN